MTGAIFRQTVPATIIRSDWRGDARNTPAPNRSRSYREETEAIISMAQQASPNVIGQRADFLDQLMKLSIVVVNTLVSNCLSINPIRALPFSRRKNSRREEFR